VCEALVRHGSDYTTVRWIRATLQGRLAVANLNVFSMRLAKFRAYLQVGVLSPLPWCLVVHDLLVRLNGSRVFIEGYADDMSSRDR
jgi:hypothetical protein